MIGLYVSVPIACWRRGHAREYLETWDMPPPSTAYGFLLSLVGEQERERHRGAAVATGMLGTPPVSRVLRTVWRVKSNRVAPGVGENARPDWQELVTQAEVVIGLDHGVEPEAGSLETRVREALANPSSVKRFGGLSLGESAHLVDEVRILSDEELARSPRWTLRTPTGDRSTAIWVDHVGSRGTRYATGLQVHRTALPSANELFPISDALP